MDLGNIVTVIYPDSFFFNFQGEVVKIEENKKEGRKSIGVRFDEQYLCMWHDYYPGKIIYFGEKDLRTEADYSLEHKVNSLFSKTMWHTLYTLKNPLDPQKLCMHEGCPKKQEKKIMLNAWGVVQESYVCAEHAKKYHGMCVDMFPYRKDGR